MIQRGQKYLASRLRERNLSGHPPGSMSDVQLPVYPAHALATLYSQNLSQHAQGCMR